MERKKKLKLPNGQEVDATILSFQAAGEHWNEYLVDDGTVIRVKVVATEVLRLDEQYDAQDNPIYLLQSTNVMAVSSPDKLKRKGS
jgi:hypothetical protein